MRTRRIILVSIGGYYSGEGLGGRMVTVASSHKHTHVFREYKKFGYDFTLSIHSHTKGGVKDNGKDFFPVSSDHGDKFGDIARHRYEARYGVIGFYKYAAYSDACRELYKVTDTINARSYNWWDSIKAIIFG